MTNTKAELALGLFALCLILAPIPAAAQSLLELWGIAQRGNPDIAALAATEVAAGIAVQRAGDDRGPTVALDIRYVTLSERPALDIPAGVIDEEPRTFYTGPDKGFGGALVARQDLYTGGAVTARIKGAEAGWGAARAQSAAGRERVCRDLIRAVFRVLSLRKRLEVLGAVEKYSEGHVARTREFLENGLLTRLEVLEAEVRYAQAERDRVTGEHALALAEKGLRRILGRDPETPIDVAGDTAFKPPPGSLSECLLAAHQNRPELAVVRAQRDQAARGIDLAASRYLPVVALSGGYHPGRSDLSQGSLSDFWELRAAVTWTPWDYGRRDHDAQRARAEVAAWESRIRSAEADVALEVEAAYRGVEQKESVVRSVAIVRARVSEAFALARERFDEGLARGTEVLEAQTLWAATESDCLGAGFELQVARAELLYAIGSLTSSLL